MPQDLNFEDAKVKLTAFFEEEATCAMVTHPDDYAVEANPYRAKFIWHNGKPAEGKYNHANTRKVDVTALVGAILKMTQDPHGWMLVEDEDDDYGSACGEIGCNVEDAIEWDGPLGDWYTPGDETEDLLKSVGG